MAEKNSVSQAPNERATLITPKLPHGGEGPVSTPKAPVPPFQAADYTFRLVSMSITNTRSRHEDTDTVSFTVQVGTDPSKAVGVSKKLGDLNNGDFPIGLSIGPLHVGDPNIGIAMNYLVVNAGNANWNTINKDITSAGKSLAEIGAKAATSAIGAAVGATIGTQIMPIVGTAIGVIAGWLAGEITGLVTADCDGPVAVEQAVFKGSELWAKTAAGVYKVTTLHPGVDSNAGCGSNSMYSMTWSVSR